LNLPSVGRSLSIVGVHRRWAGSNITDPSFVPELREYKIVPATYGDPALLCDGLLTEDLVNVASFEYHFETTEE